MGGVVTVDLPKIEPGAKDTGRGTGGQRSKVKLFPGEISAIVIESNFVKHGSEQNRRLLEISKRMLGVYFPEKDEEAGLGNPLPDYTFSLNGKKKDEWNCAKYIDK